MARFPFPPATPTAALLLRAGLTLTALLALGQSAGASPLTFSTFTRAPGASQTAVILRAAPVATAPHAPPLHLPSTGIPAAHGTQRVPSSDRGSVPFRSSLLGAVGALAFALGCTGLRRRLLGVPSTGSAAVPPTWAVATHSGRKDDGLNRRKGRKDKQPGGGGSGDAATEGDVVINVGSDTTDLTATAPDPPTATDCSRPPAASSGVGTSVSPAKGGDRPTGRPPRDGPTRPAAKRPNPDGVPKDETKEAIKRAVRGAMGQPARGLPGPAPPV